MAKLSGVYIYPDALEAVFDDESSKVFFLINPNVAYPKFMGYAAYPISKKNILTAADALAAVYKS